jgi:arylsulfatase A
MVGLGAVGAALLPGVGRGAEDVAQGSGKSRPNIIMILTDDVGIGNVSCYGADKFKTPNVDSLARNGLRFSQCYAMPQCSPTRCVALTGRYPFRTGLLGNHDREAVDPKREVMIPTVMKQAGYVTASVGKWHVGPLGPGEWGFDEYLVFPGSGLYWRGDKAQSKYYNVNGQKHDLPEGQYLPDIMHEFLVNFLAKHKDDRFFVYYPMSHIHGTIVRTPDSKPGADEDRLYADNIEYMDKLVGKLMAELDRLHLREKTLVLFTGDNGTSGDYAKKATVNGRSINGHKLKLLEGGSRVPLIANWPGVTPAGKVLNDLVDFSDFFTTFADLGGAKLPEGVKLDGQSFAPQLRGEKGELRDWIFVQLGAKWYVRDQGFKLTESGELFDMTDAPFVEKPATDDAEKAKLQAILNQLNPAGGKTASGDVKPGKAGNAGKEALKLEDKD